ncbi:MAG: DUF4880 domain-containing protein [Sphingobium sp.]|nr:DUF4880 domain-containing protein [Sphingobium sp.]
MNDISTSHDSHTVQQNAIHWAVRAAHNSMSAQDKDALRNWLAADTRHQGAYLRAKAGLKIMERGVLAEEQGRIPQNDNDATDPVTKDRRIIRRFGGVALASLAIAACIAGLVTVTQPSLSPPMAQSLAATQKLKDGSVVTLSHGAQIHVAMTGDTRKITLLSGKAVFHVAKDTTRPFVVQSGAIYAQATGTVYSVQRMGTLGGAVHVTEGSVLVWARDEREQAVLLHAGDRLTLDTQPNHSDNAQAQASMPLPQPAVAKISLDNVPLAQAVARFNKVNSRQIIISDPEIGEVEIVGLFNANNPDRFAKSAAILAGGELSYEGRNIVIKLKK